MKRLIGCVLLMTGLLQGCSIFPEAKFVPSDPEALSEWSVEGKMSIKSKHGKQKTWFVYKEIEGGYELAVKPDSPTQAPVAVLSGYNGEADVKVDLRDEKAQPLVLAMQEQLPMDNLSYWLRALPVTAAAEIEQDDDLTRHIKESGWDIDYDNYMRVERYSLPDQLSMKKDKTKIKVDLVRAEAGFLSSPCPADYMPGNLKLNRTDVTTATGEKKTVLTLVPRDGEPPAPRWIDEQDLCEQLYKVHGKIPDPKVGLYGPDSMMWKVIGPITPSAMGAGRALLLQTAHPWVTAGIDEHSIVRYDPMVRAQRTILFISTLVYGSMPQVMSAAHELHNIHKEVEGHIPYDAGAFKQGSEYRANEVSAMIWVQATLWDTSIKMYEDIQGELTAAEKEQFYEESKLFAMMFGIPRDALPADWNEFQDYVQSMELSPQLTVTDNARTLKQDLFDARSILLVFPLWVQEVVTSANLPPRIREGYGMDYGLWERINYAWIMPSARVYNWILPDGMAINPVQHEAEARLRGERVGWYQRMLINTLGVPSLVN